MNVYVRRYNTASRIVGLAYIKWERVHEFSICLWAFELVLRWKGEHHDEA